MTGMEQRLSMVSLGVRDLTRARAFYEALGWRAAAPSNDSIVFFDLGGFALGLYGWDALAEDAATSPDGTGFRGFALAHNVRSEAEADAVIQAAVAAGGTLIKAAEKVFWGGYSGYFADPDGHLWEVAYNPFLPLDDNGRMTLPDT